MPPAGPREVVVTMVRVTHGKFTKAVSKKMRPAEELEEDDDVSGSDAEAEYKDSDAEISGSDDDDENSDDENSDDDEGPDKDGGATKPDKQVKKSRKRNQFVDDVADEDEDEEASEDEAPAKKKSKKHPAWRT